MVYLCGLLMILMECLRLDDRVRLLIVNGCLVCLSHSLKEP